MLLASLVISVSASPCFAQGEAYDAVIDEAVVEFQAARWEEARALFRRAHELQPNARTLRGIGMASFELRDYAEAVVSLDAALRSEVRPLTQRQREMTQSLLERGLLYVARLTNADAVDTSAITIDERPVVTYDNSVVLNPGRHTLRFLHPQAGPLTRRFEVRAGETLELAAVIPGTAEPGAPADEAAAEADTSTSDTQGSEGAIAPTEGAEAAAPTPPPASGPPDDGGSARPLRAAGWAVAGAGAGAGVAAIVTGIIAGQEHDRLTRECGGPCPESLRSEVERGDRLARTSTALTFVGVAALGTGVLLIVLGRGDGDEPSDGQASRAAFVPVVGRGVGGAQLTVTY